MARRLPGRIEEQLPAVDDDCFDTVDDRANFVLVLTLRMMKPAPPRWKAWGWLYNDEALMGAGRPLPGTRVGRLIEMLEPNEDEA